MATQPGGIMEDRRTALAVLLSVIVVMMYSQYILPSARQAQPAPVVTAGAPLATGLTVPQTGPATMASSATMANPASMANPATIANPATPTLPTASAAGGVPSQSEIMAAERTTVSSPRVHIEITHLGARFSKFELTEHRRTLGSEAALDMIASLDGAALPLGVYVPGGSDARVSYTRISVSPPQALDATTGNVTVADEGETVITFAGVLADGAKLQKSISINPDSYLMGVTVTAEGATASSIQSPVWLEWNHVVPTNSASRVDEIEFTYLGSNSKLTHQALKDFHAAPALVGANKWLSLGDRYFFAALVSAAPFSFIAVRIRAMFRFAAEMACGFLMGAVAF